MKAGSTQRFDCGDCNTEFDVTYEPKCKPSEVDTFEEVIVSHCPFCGYALAEIDEDETGE